MYSQGAQPQQLEQLMTQLGGACTEAETAKKVKTKGYGVGQQAAAGCATTAPLAETQCPLHDWRPCLLAEHGSWRRGENTGELTNMADEPTLIEKPDAHGGHWLKLAGTGTLP